MVRELSLAPIHPDAPPATDKRCRIRLKKVGDALLLGRLSEAPPGQEFHSGIASMLVHRKHVRIEGEPPVLTALGAQPCVVINSTGRLKLIQGQSCVLELSWLVPPGSSVLYAWGTRTSLLRAVCTGGTGQLAPGASRPVRTTSRTSLGRAVRTALPWHSRC